VTRNTRAHQSFSRKWNLLPSSRRISAPCTQYFARPRAAIVRYAHRVRRTAFVYARMTRRILHVKGTKFRKCRDRFKRLTKRETKHGYSWLNDHRNLRSLILIFIFTTRKRKRNTNLEASINSYIRSKLFFTTSLL